MRVAAGTFRSVEELAADRQQGWPQDLIQGSGVWGEGGSSHHLEVPTQGRDENLPDPFADLCGRVSFLHRAGTARARTLDRQRHCWIQARDDF